MAKNPRKPAPPAQAARKPATSPRTAAPLQTVKDRSQLVWAAILFIIASAVYLNTLGHDYAFDDTIVITDNRFTQSGLAGLPDLLSRDFFEGISKGDNMNLPGGRYRPLSMVTFAIEYELAGGLSPGLSHAVNVLMYGFTAVLMFLVLGQWFGRKSAVPFLATLLFAIHPIHTEAVANIKSRDEVLCLLMMFAALYALWKSLEGRRSLNWAIAGSVFFFLAMMSKESGFMYMPLLPAILWVFRPEMNLRQIAVRCAPFWIAGMAYYLLRAAMLAKYSFDVVNPDIMENPFVRSDFSERWGTQGSLLLRYFGLLLFPHPMSCDYSYHQIPYVQLFHPVSLLGWGIHLAMFAFAAWGFMRRHVAALCVALYFLPLFPVSNIPFNIGAPMADRFLYLPSVGFAIFVAWGLCKLFKISDFEAFKRSAAVLGLTGLLVLLGAWKTIDRNPAWANNLTLFEADVKSVPNSAKIHYYYGNSLQKVYMDKQVPENKKFVELAIKEFERAVEINPDFHTVTYNLGLAYDLLNDAANARKWLNRTLELQPNHINSTLLMGKILCKYNIDPVKGIEYLRRYIFDFKRDDSDGNMSLGLAYAMTGNLAEAEPFLVKAANLDPNNFNAVNNLAAFYLNTGQPAKAAVWQEKAKSLKK